MPTRLGKAQLLPRLAMLFTERGLSLVHPDATDPQARVAQEVLAGLPHSEQIWTGTLRSDLLVAVASGERQPGVEMVRRAQLFAQRAAVLGVRLKGPVQVLQLAVYERPVPQQERDFILAKGALGFPLLRGKVATWVYALDELVLHARRFRGWPDELGPSELRRALVSPAA